MQTNVNTRATAEFEALPPSYDTQRNKEQRNYCIQHPGTVITVYRHIERSIALIDLGNNPHSFFTVSSIQIAGGAHCFHCVSLIISGQKLQHNCLIADLITGFRYIVLQDLNDPCLFKCFPFGIIKPDPLNLVIPVQKHCKKGG